MDLTTTLKLCASQDALQSERRSERMPLQYYTVAIKTRPLETTVFSQYGLLTGLLFCSLPRLCDQRPDRLVVPSTGNYLSAYVAYSLAVAKLSRRHKLLSPFARRHAISWAENSIFWAEVCHKEFDYFDYEILKMLKGKQYVFTSQDALSVRSIKKYFPSISDLSSGIIKANSAIDQINACRSFREELKNLLQNSLGSSTALNRILDFYPLYSWLLGSLKNLRNILIVSRNNESQIFPFIAGLKAQGLIEESVYTAYLPHAIKVTDSKLSPAVYHADKILCDHRYEISDLLKHRKRKPEVRNFSKTNVYIHERRITSDRLLVVLAPSRPLRGFSPFEKRRFCDLFDAVSRYAKVKIKIKNNQSLLSRIISGLVLLGYSRKAALSLWRRDLPSLMREADVACVFLDQTKYISNIFEEFSSALPERCVVLCGAGCGAISEHWEGACLNSGGVESDEVKVRKALQVAATHQHSQGKKRGGAIDRSRRSIELRSVRDTFLEWGRVARRSD